MIKIITLVFSTLFLTEAIALRIICPADGTFEGKVSDIEISYMADEDTWIVSIKAPASIKGLDFSRFMIGKGENGNILAVPLHTEISEDAMKAHFYANEAMLNDMALSVLYGDTCPKRIVVPLKLNKNGITTQKDARTP